jgi:hypothetical protein
LNENWKELFKLACMFLKDAKISEDKWTLGGGTVLSIYYHHRISKDIDIFFNEAQFLTFLTPRLNDNVASHTKQYDEQSNFLKLRFAQGEIDFIVAPRLTALRPVLMTIEGTPVLTDSPDEIVIKKMFYRAETLKARDILDIAVVVKNKKKDIIKNLNIFSGKLGTISERVSKISRDYEKLVQSIEIIDEKLAKESLLIVDSFLNECLRLTRDKK